MNGDTLNAWARKRADAGHGTIGLLKTIGADGQPGTHPRGDSSTRRPMPDSLADNLTLIVGSSGVAGSDARRYLVDLLRWHYGYSRGQPTASYGKLKERDFQFVRRRAYELVNEHRDLMPEPTKDRPAA